MMKQRWDKLAFMHWQVPVDVLRPHIPPGLAIDTFDGTAWIGIVPFTMSAIWPARESIRLDFHEINVRTYVVAEDFPGAWFFSLDAASVAAVLGGRTGFSLPYFYSRIELEAWEDRIRFDARRIHPGAPRATFSAEWSNAGPLQGVDDGSLERFLTERYCLYTQRRGTLYRARVAHDPWPLCAVASCKVSSTLIESSRLPSPVGEPLVHGVTWALDVEVWPLEEVFNL